MCQAVRGRNVLPLWCLAPRSPLPRRCRSAESPGSWLDCAKDFPLLRKKLAWDAGERFQSDWYRHYKKELTG